MTSNCAEFAVTRYGPGYEKRPTTQIFGQRAVVMSFATLLTWVPLAAVVFYVIVTFNRLVKGRNACVHARASIDVYLKQRHQLIPNLVEAVAGFTAHEQATLQQVTEARAQAIAELQGIKSAAQERQLDDALRGLDARVEAYPELLADKTFVNLQKNLTEAEAQISAARRAYNGQVLVQNDLVQQFPSLLVAKLCGFVIIPPYTADEASRVAPAATLQGNTA